ncbi:MULTISPECIES: hypothetical protein [Pseudomonas]|uniref:hypothetical protein n=1 Tax=Pseudomonas TaxID=286 RepID=UPI001647A9E1|nr:hypothetical protein [Pseudomonas shirazensis]MBV4500542.1 hypothetical protein [Pseudomonas shirazensis]
MADRISQSQYRDIRPKAAFEIAYVDHASLLLDHTKGDIAERVYRRVRALAKPNHPQWCPTERFCLPKNAKSPE